MLASGTGLALGVAVAGCGGSDSDDGGDDYGGKARTVDMDDQLAYVPSTLRVSVGDTVIWSNKGSNGHSVTAYADEIPDGAEYFASGGFESEQAARNAYEPGKADAGDIPGGETWEHTFETAGTYGYFCIPHEQGGMVGTIDVEG